MRDPIFHRLDAKSSPLVPLIKECEWLKSEVENLETTIGHLTTGGGFPEQFRCEIGLAEVNGPMLSSIPVDINLTRRLFEAELIRVKALYADLRSRLAAAESAAQCEAGHFHG